MYIWNTISGILNASEAVLMSMIVMRTTGLSDAGVLTIAFAVGNLFSCIGKFGVRNIQATDQIRKFTFREYFFARLLSVVFMLIAVITYLRIGVNATNNIAEEKLVILVICLVYASEAVEDVFWGLYQQNNHLEVGAKMFCARWVVLIFIFAINMILGRSLLFSLVTASICSYCVLIVAILITFPQYRKKENISFKASLEILKQGFPLMTASFFEFYLINAPKFSISEVMNNEAEAAYGFIAMPVFAIGLLSSFIYAPVIVKMSNEWNLKHYDTIRLYAVRQLRVIAVITIICAIASYFIGIPVLSAIYAVSLKEYRSELVILLIGGGFLAVASYVIVIFTIMRCQIDAIWISIISSVIAYLMLTPAVFAKGITGAAIAFLIIMIIYCGMCMVDLKTRFVKIIGTNNFEKKQ